MSYCPPSTPSKTPTAKRRNSLPNGEGLGLRMEYGRLGEVWKTQVHTPPNAPLHVFRYTNGNILFQVKQQPAGKLTHSAVHLKVLL